MIKWNENKAFTRCVFGLEGLKMCEGCRWSTYVAPTMLLEKI